MNINQALTKNYEMNSLAAADKTKPILVRLLSAFYPPQAGWRIYPPPAEFPACPSEVYALGGWDPVVALSFPRKRESITLSAICSPDSLLLPISLGLADLHQQEENEYLNKRK